MVVKYFDSSDKRAKVGRKHKYDFHKLEPNSFIEIDFQDDSQVKSIRSSYSQYRKLHNPDWKGGVRLIDSKINIIRWE